MKLAMVQAAGTHAAHTDTQAEPNNNDLLSTAELALLAKLEEANR